MQLFQLSYSDIFLVQKDFLIFYLQHHQTSYQSLFQWARSFWRFDRELNSDEIYTFWPKSWVNTQDKCKFFTNLNKKFILSRKTSFLPKTPSDIISRPFRMRNKFEEFSSFWPEWGVCGLTPKNNENISTIL